MKFKHKNFLMLGDSQSKTKTEEGIDLNILKIIRTMNMQYEMKNEIKVYKGRLQNNGVK